MVERGEQVSFEVRDGRSRLTFPMKGLGYGLQYGFPNFCSQGLSFSLRILAAKF